MGTASSVGVEIVRSLVSLSALVYRGPAVSGATTVEEKGGSSYGMR